MIRGTSRQGPALVWPAAMAVAYTVAFVLVYYLTVRTELGRVVSDASLRGALLSGASFRGTVDAILDIVSVGSLLGAVATVAVIALIRLDRVRGLAAVGVLVTANLATQVLKEHLLERPDLGLDEVAPATLNSLPSGHTTAAFSAVAALLIVLPTAWRLLAALLGGGFATITALATMFAGWHRTADAMGAFLVVGVCTMVAIAVVVAYASPRASAHAPVGFKRWLVAAAGALVLGSVLGIVFSALAPDPDSLMGAFLAFLAFLSAGLLIIGTVIVVLAGILWVLQVTEAETDRKSERT